MILDISYISRQFLDKNKIRKYVNLVNKKCFWSKFSV